MFREKKQARGFTLLEILLVVAAIAILASIVIVALNPGKQLAEIRNAQRRNDVGVILNAAYQHIIDNQGSLPSSITLTATEICKTGAADCSGLADLSVLTEDETYLVSLPQDPNGNCSANGICYQIYKSANGRITVLAPHAERGVTISATR